MWLETISYCRGYERAIEETNHSGTASFLLIGRRWKIYSGWEKRPMLDGILLTVTPVSQMAQDTSWGGRRVGELDQNDKALPGEVSQYTSPWEVTLPVRLRHSRVEGTKVWRGWGSAGSRWGPHGHHSFLCGRWQFDNVCWTVSQPEVQELWVT